MKRLFVKVGLAMLAMGLLTACNSDDEVNNGFVEPDNSTPEFTSANGWNPKHTEQGDRSITDIADITYDGMGEISWIVFTDLTKAPKTGPDYFRQYMNLGPDDSFRLEKNEVAYWMEPATYEDYQQLYKGIPVYSAHYDMYYNNGQMTGAGGTYIRISDVDVKPAFSVLKAKEIYARYLNTSPLLIEQGGMLAYHDDALVIAEFPLSEGSSVWKPRLVYALQYNHEANYEGFCMIDAHTGRILRTWPNGYYCTVY